MCHFWKGLRSFSENINSQSGLWGRTGIYNEFFKPNQNHLLEWPRSEYNGESLLGLKTDLWKIVFPIRLSLSYFAENYGRESYLKCFRVQICKAGSGTPWRYKSHNCSKLWFQKLLNLSTECVFHFLDFYLKEKKSKILYHFTYI